MTVVNLYRNKDATVNDAFDRTIFNICLQREKSGHKVFLLCGCEPGVGTTTISVELSISLALAGWKVLLLDGDFRKEKEYKRLNEGLAKGIADYIQGKATKEDIVKKTNWENLSYIPSGNLTDVSPVSLLYANKLMNIISEARNEYDVIIIDAPALSAAVDANIFAVQSDATILVASMDGRKRKMLERAYEQLCGEHINVIGVIENRLEMSEYKSYINNFNYFNNKQYVKKKK